MVDIDKIIAGRSYAIFTISNGGRCIVRDFIKALNTSDQKKIVALLKRTAEHGTPKNTEKFDSIQGTSLWEFKSFQIRIFCFFNKSKMIILTHGFIKKKQKTPKQEIEKALRLMKEYQKETGKNEK